MVVEETNSTLYSIFAPSPPQNTPPIPNTTHTLPTSNTHSRTYGPLSTDTIDDNTTRLCFTNFNGLNPSKRSNQLRPYFETMFKYNVSIAGGQEINCDVSKKT
jgi:hypothetical protein